MYRYRHTPFQRYPGTSTGLGLGLAAAAGAALAYFLYGTEAGREKREQLMGWASHTTEKTTWTVKELSAVSKEIYGDMRNLVRDKYDDLKTLNQEEIGELADRIREHWTEAKDDIVKTLDELKNTDES